MKQNTLKQTAMKYDNLEFPAYIFKLNEFTDYANLHQTLLDYPNDNHYYIEILIHTCFLYIEQRGSPTLDIDELATFLTLQYNMNYLGPGQATPFKFTPGVTDYD